VKIFHRIREKLSVCATPSLAPNSTRAQRGQYGEDLAAHHCKYELGYRIIARNWRYQRDEIDLICQNEKVLVFIEVRSRDSEALVDGFHSIGAKKKKILLRVYKNYLRQLKIPPKHFRFDIISIALSTNKRGEVHHYKNVPLFNKHFSAHPKI